MCTTTISIPLSRSLSFSLGDRLSRDEQTGVVTTYAYDGDGKKRSAVAGVSLSTFVWDGEDYLQARS